MRLRDLNSADLSACWALNQANAPAVGDVSLEQFERLVTFANVALVATDDDGTLLGFCLVMPPGTSYESLNYRWFCERYVDFVYLDRVAVAQSAPRHGVGRALYAEVERRARLIPSATWFTLEVNVRPRNDASLLFHRGQGFVEVGQQDTKYGTRVAMMVKRL